MPDRRAAIATAATVATTLFTVFAPRWALADTVALDAAVRELEAQSQGRLGVHVLDGGSGREWGHRSDERFLMLSSFKTLIGALVLARADAGLAPLTKRVRYAKADLVSWSPVTEKHVGGEGLSLAELCEATITTSDNTAANLILAEVGGPPALTAFLRRIGDGVTRLDRTEPELNTAVPGQDFDTTTPRAMARSLRTLLLGDALSPASRAQLAAWLKANTTGGKRLRAGVPEGWAIGEKTGTAGQSANDAGIVWPPGRAPLLVSAYLADSPATPAVREQTLAGVGRLLARW
jgi:beta-lactamase class A